MTALKKILCIALSASMLASVSSLVSSAQDVSTSAVKLTYYKNAEKTEAYADGEELPTNETVYYSVSIESGVVLRGLDIKADSASRDSFVIGDSAFSVTPDYYVLGDANGDGKLSSSDIIFMKRYFLFWNMNPGSSKPIAENCDVDGDKVMSLNELIAINRMYLGWGLPDGAYSDYYSAGVTSDYAIDSVYAAPALPDIYPESSAAVINSPAELSAWISSMSASFDLTGTSPEYTSGYYYDLCAFSQSAVTAKYDDAYFAENTLVISSRCRGSASAAMNTTVKSLQICGDAVQVTELDGTDKVPLGTDTDVHMFITIPKTNASSANLVTSSVATRAYN